MNGTPRLSVVLLTAAKLGVFMLGVIALTATGAPYQYTFAEDPGRVSVLTHELPELRFRVLVCGIKPFTGGGLLGNDPLFGEPQRSEIHVFVDDSDAEIRFELRRSGVSDSKSLKAVNAPTKIFDRDLRLELMPDGVYCDSQTELRLATGGAGANTAVRWHVEVPYFADIDGSPVTPPSIIVEPLP